MKGIIVSAVIFLPSILALPSPNDAPWMDSRLPVDDRVELLLSKMTNLEKQAQTIHALGMKMPDIQKMYGATSLGALSAEGDGSAESIRNQNEIQAYFVNNSRLHIPVTFNYETLHSGGKTSSFNICVTDSRVILVTRYIGLSLIHI